jgi:hypothetical protein
MMPANSRGFILGKLRFGWKQPNWFLPIFACGFGLLWLVTAGLSVVGGDSQALNAFQEGDYQLVEGNVTDFKPMPYEGHQEKCFSVQGKRFCYSDYVIAPGFRNTTSHGGPIRAGLPVRIAYSGDAILRIEIPKDQVLNPSEIVATTNSAKQAWQTRANNDPVERRQSHFKPDSARPYAGAPKAGFGDETPQFVFSIRTPHQAP